MIEPVGVDALLLFDEQHPCWKHAMFALLGLDPELLDALWKEGSLECGEGVYSLSKEGEARFTRAAGEAFVPLRPGRPSCDPKRDAARSYLQLLLDKGHLQRWGLKEFCKPFRFEIPDLAEGELFEDGAAGLEWRYPQIGRAHV